MGQKVHSLANRLSLRIILATLATMTVISVLVFGLAFIGISVLTQAHFQDVMEVTNARIGTILQAVEVSAENIVDEVDYTISVQGNLEEALSSELKLNPHLIGCGVGFVPNFYPKRGKWYEPFARFSGKTVITGQFGSASHDYLESDWFKGGMAHKSGYWSVPYFDADGTGEMICTYALPVHGADNVQAGVLCSDVSLEWLTRQVHSFSERTQNQIFPIGGAEDGQETDLYSFIVGKGGVYVVHPDRERILKKTFFDYENPEDTPYVRRQYRELGEKMLSGESGMMAANLDNERSVVYFAPLRKTNWCMAIVVPRRAVLFPGLIIAAWILLLIAIGLVVTFLFCYFTIWRATAPLKALSSSAQEVARGNLDAALPIIRRNDEIRQLRDSFEEMEHSLVDHIDRLKTATAQEASFQRELGIARNIQMAMLPEALPPESVQVSVAGSLTPAKAVGGDLYDYFIRDGKLFFCIGDVSGKGIPAALVMSVTITLLRSLAGSEDRPDKIASALNHSASARNDSLMFVTLFTGVLDLATGLLRYCNSGHNAPVLIDSAGGVRFLPVEANVAVGVLPDYEFKSQELLLRPGDGLLLYTDGLTEAENREHELFGEERMISSLKKQGAAAPGSLLVALQDSVHRFVDGAEQSDDLTLLGIQFLGK